MDARLALFLGDDELAAGVVKLRDLATGAEHAVAREALLDELNRSA
ncbi:His/Gly/Thr/Pro-type tRNA ligase C-terminal domain-containing protein [Geminicoccus harenae]|nr:His/Gly/Thr/Pro-type tRNA ligase C-terminal domain-containing protein [Geminicoccus harenae]